MLAVLRLGVKRVAGPSLRLGAWTTQLGRNTLALATASNLTGPEGNSKFPAPIALLLITWTTVRIMQAALHTSLRISTSIKC